MTQQLSDTTQQRRRLAQYRASIKDLQAQARKYDWAVAHATSHTAVSIYQQYALTARAQACYMRRLAAELEHDLDRGR